MSGRALVLSDSSIGFNLESHSDLWLDSALVDNTVPIKLKSFSNARLALTSVLKNQPDIDTSSQLYLPK